MRRARAVYVNTLQRAAARSALLSPADRAEMVALGERALEMIRTGTDGRGGWCHMADVLNMAEALATAPARHAVAADAASLAKIAAAQDALGALHARAHGPLRSWTARADELAALREALWLWAVQMDHCTVGELDAAARTVENKVRQALAGNAPRGTRVVAAPAAGGQGP